MESKPNSDLIIRWIQRPSSWVPVFVFFAAVLGFALYFPAVSSYLILGIVLALMAHPIFTRLKALRFRGKAIPNSLASVVSLTALMLFFVLFWLFLLPLIGYQLSNWQKINAEQVVEALDEPIGLSVRWLSDYGLGGATVDSVLHYSPGKPISNPDIALQLRHKIQIGRAHV